MAPNTKRVFYVNTVAAPIYLEILAKRPDIHMDKLANDTPEGDAEPVLAHAHAYQIGSSRQELAMKLQGYAPLLKPLPEPTGAVHQRRRVRHGQPEGCHSGGRRGSQPGRRQQGRCGGARAWQ